MFGKRPVKGYRQPDVNAFNEQRAKQARGAHKGLGRGSTAKHNPRLASHLGSGARKVRISIILMSQSALVQDLDLSGPLRENFSRLALDTRTIRQMIDNDEADRKRREALSALLPSQGD